MPRLVLLLPPSEGKAPGGRGTWTPSSGRFEVLADARRTVAAALQAAPDAVLGVGGAHLERARAANAALLDGPPALPAASRYTGVVWEHLDVASLPAPAKRRATQSILVVSGLLGVVALGDPVPDYRLKMGARLPALGSVQRWWRPHLAAALETVVRRADVVDLLPNEHRGALVDVDRDTALRWRTVGFERRDRPGGAVGHEAKATKGLLARHLLLGGTIEDFPAGPVVPYVDA